MSDFPLRATGQQCPFHSGYSFTRDIKTYTRKLVIGDLPTTGTVHVALEAFVVFIGKTIILVLVCCAVRGCSGATKRDPGKAVLHAGRVYVVIRRVRAALVAATRFVGAKGMRSR